jgi:hypothetical protein
LLISRNADDGTYWIVPKICSTTYRALDVDGTGSKEDDSGLINYVELSPAVYHEEGAGA